MWDDLCYHLCRVPTFKPSRCLGIGAWWRCGRLPVQIFVTPSYVEEKKQTIGQNFQSGKGGVIVVPRPKEGVTSPFLPLLSSLAPGVPSDLNAQHMSRPMSVLPSFHQIDSKMAMPVFLPEARMKVRFECNATSSCAPSKNSIRSREEFSFFVLSQTEAQLYLDWFEMGSVVSRYYLPIEGVCVNPPTSKARTRQ
jgi:hypothetical protein